MSYFTYNHFEFPLYQKYREYIHFEQWDIVLADFGENIATEKNGIRPAVVISKEIINRSSGNIIVAPITKVLNKRDECGQLKLYSSHVFLSAKYFKGLKYPSIVQMEDIRSISRNRIIEYVDRLSEFKINQCKEALESIIC